ncbi:MAG: DUF1844 domain-containing protein [Acidobacteria bacterium]|nr:DUF1844 domain-containing protein [Acidobacteriota bacterium]
MSDKEKEPETVRVVDRRRFTDQGERRKDVEESDHAQESPHVLGSPPPPRSEPAASATSQPNSRAARETRRTAEPALPGGEPKMDFETLVLSLSTTTMYQLGLVEGPDQAPIPADLQAARQTLDMLAVIEEKTRGNLSTREQQLLEQALYELRLTYVQLSGQETPAPSSASP